MKRRTLLLITACLVLGACTLVPSEPSAATITVDRTGDFHFLVVNPGREDALTIELTLLGQALRVNDANCRAIGAQLKCTFAHVPANHVYQLPFDGMLAAAFGSYQRPNRPERLPLVYP